MGATAEVHVGSVDLHQFRDPQPGAVCEREQGMVASPGLLDSPPEVVTRRRASDLDDRLGRRDLLLELIQSCRFSLSDEQVPLSRQSGNRPNGPHWVKSRTCAPSEDGSWQRGDHGDGRLAGVRQACGTAMGRCA